MIVLAGPVESIDGAPSVKSVKKKTVGFVARSARLRPPIGGRVARNVFASGALASELFGSEVHGVSDFVLLTYRHQAGS
eukprot:9472705-Pyramimonas_sp.AAC.1